jgi:hypothetical protein
MSAEDFAFFAFNNFNRPDISSLYNDYKEYLMAEDELEMMIKDNVVDIYVSDSGEFHYYPSKCTLDALGGKITGKFSTFKEMLARRNLNIDRYNRYKHMLRRLKS